MDVLLTGAYGRVGTAVLDPLAGREDYEFTCLDREDHPDHETVVVPNADVGDTATLVVDGERTLLSARVDGTETAVWSDAASHGFAAVLRAMVTGRRDTE